MLETQQGLTWSGWRYLWKMKVWHLLKLIQGRVRTPLWCLCTFREKKSGRYQVFSTNTLIYYSGFWVAVNCLTSRCILQREMPSYITFSGCAMNREPNSAQLLNVSLGNQIESNSFLLHCTVLRCHIEQRHFDSSLLCFLYLF